MQQSKIAADTYTTPTCEKFSLFVSDIHWIEEHEFSEKQSMDGDGSCGGDEGPWICKVELSTQISSPAYEEQHQVLFSG